MEFGLALFAADRGIRPWVAAEAAERAGFGAFYVGQHTHIPVDHMPHPQVRGQTNPDDRYQRMPDPWVGLSMAAAVTTRIRLGTSVALPLEEDPITLGKVVASLDHFSGGRVVFGVGFGWNVEEMADHRVPMKSRRRAVAERLALMRSMWTDDVAAYSGEFVSLSPSWCWPKPSQRGGPPVLLGVGASERNLRWVAAHADGWMTMPNQAGIANELDSLVRMWDLAGREGRPRIHVLERDLSDCTLRSYRELGVDEVQVGLPDVPEQEALETIAKYGEQIAAMK